MVRTIQLANFRQNGKLARSLQSMSRHQLKLVEDDIMTRSTLLQAQASTIALMLLIPLLLGFGQSFRPELPAPSAAFAAVGVQVGLA